MANELIVKNGLIIESGGLWVTGSIRSNQPIIATTASFALTASFSIQNETQYRFEQITVIDQDIWLDGAMITRIVKSAGVSTAEYKINAGSYQLINFTGNEFVGNISISSNDVLSWRITYNSGYTSAALIVLHSKV